ncbi:EAL domain-containing protein [Sphingomonas fuzhouensis]|uniref:EAL domain-containing protein n=1 Tax=Sphingomonas fuzhouensis TaxID=3106033 RepID=UPI002AFF0280|nr:EAL domain-containing protein [Sphingomonas sp. SGZ-02]
MSLRICNFHHIDRAYGWTVAAAVATEVRRRLVEALPATSHVMSGGADTLLAGISHGVGQDAEGEAAEALFPIWLASFCSATLGRPITTEAGPLGVWLSGDWAVGGREGGRIFPFGGPSIGNEADAAALYRADMALAVEVLPMLLAPRDGGATESGRSLVLYWQPVIDGSGSDAVLYHEALCRLCDPDGATGSPEPLLLALERLGFVCALDRYVVSSVIDELEAAPGVTLAANVSAQSLSCTQSWSEILERLGRRPDIARRLVWEITETALVADMNRAVAFVSLVKSLGCRIAIDDFGVGFASIRQLLIFSPDIIKIDRLFLDRATLSARDAGIFRQLVELARSFGAEVVAEGIETAAQADFVRSSGVSWQQGYLHAKPSLTRLWRQGWTAGSEAPGAMR